MHYVCICVRNYIGVITDMMLVTFLQIGGGLLADTPGFNVPSITNLTVANLQTCFPEIQRQLETER